MATPRTHALENALMILEVLRRIPRQRYTTSTQIHQQLLDAGHTLVVRTVQRHLEAICGRFAVECDTRSRPYGYRWMEGAEGLNMPQLTTSEALLLQLAKSEVSQLLPSRTLASMAPLFSSAQRTLETTASAQVERRWLQKVQRIPDGQPLLPPQIIPEVFETISEALYLERKLQLHYRNVQRQDKQATVWPLGLVQQGVRLYLVCRFDGYDNQRVLALPRITQAQMLLEGFPWPERFDLDAYCREGTFGISRGQQVHLRFEMAKIYAQHLLDAPLSTDQTVEDVGEDWVAISATVADTELLHRWLRSWGEQVRSISTQPVAQD